MINLLNKSWRWNNKNNENSKKAPEPKDSGGGDSKEGKSDSLKLSDPSKESALKMLEKVLEGMVKDEGKSKNKLPREPTPPNKAQVNQVIESHLSSAQKLAKIDNLLKARKEKKASANSSKSYEGVSVTQTESQVIERPPQYCNPNRLPLQLQELEHKDLVGKYKSVLENAFYGCIERVGLYHAKSVGSRKTDLMKYDIPKVLERSISRKPLNACKEFLVKEEMFLMLDTSGSCAAMATLVNTIAKIASKRGDICTIKSGNISVYYKSDVIYNEMKAKEINTEHKRYYKLDPSISDEPTLFDITNLKNRTVMILSDSDCNDALNIFLSRIGVKKVIFLDMHNYILHRWLGNQIHNLEDYNSNGFNGNYTNQNSVETYFSQMDKTMKWIMEGAKDKVLNPLKVQKTKQVPFKHNFSSQVEWYRINDAPDLLRAFLSIK